MEEWYMPRLAEAIMNRCPFNERMAEEILRRWGFTKEFVEQYKLRCLKRRELRS